MTPNSIYEIIRNMGKRKRVNADGFFMGLDDENTVEFEYAFDMGSGINVVGPRDSEGNFCLVEIDDTGIKFTKIIDNGKDGSVLDLSTEEAFFQADTVTDMVMTFSEYQDLYMDFMKYYNGFLCHLTVYLRN